ncbi:LPS export ABC transporter periplasmic protein LptC [Thiomicrorhabdus sp. 6S2-11]|uniref:LPS export ABC transporter periplasmic protein LptC n=1 Tax=Thiomicrorhabdus marina TaxID=2818442 RepID=A0ABS3Q1V1_9GAMM|nr:LPS export ABC transporter periplasmic protein LptC [Thiomicrorhabdus marina]MBO1926295.1 LPS export ABC transporter periplasmic protein LptC [Thiomicrorhabdus marina]
MRLSKSHLLILSLALAAFALWLNIWLESNQQEQEDTPQTLAEQAVWQFKDTQLWLPSIQTADNENGEHGQQDTNLYFYAKQITYQQQHNTQIETLNLASYSANQFNLISSDQAQIDKNQSMQFTQQENPVQLQHWRESEQKWHREIQISGAEFTYNGQQQTLLSEQPVTLTQPDAEIQAGNLQADIKTGDWNFGKGVEGLFQLPQRTE